MLLQMKKIFEASAGKRGRSRGAEIKRGMISLALCAAMLGSNICPVLSAAAEGEPDGATPEKDMEIKTAIIRVDDAEQDLKTNESFNVDYSKQATLHITVKSKLNLKDKKVEIKVPDGLVVAEYPTPNSSTGMVTSVTPESIEDLNSENSYGGYKPKSGVITYSLRDTAENSSFNIILEPDTVLWNRRIDQRLSEPLEIKVYSGDSPDEPYDTVSSKMNITGQPLSTGPRLWSVGVKTGTPTQAGQAFAMRQVWVNPDKDRHTMGMFCKTLSITIALPHDTSKDKYAVFDRVTYDLVGSDKINWLDPDNHDEDSEFSFNQTMDENTVTLTWNNLYLDGSEYFTPYFKWEDSCDAEDAIEWKTSSIYVNDENNGVTNNTKDPAAIGGKITWNDGSTWDFHNDAFKAINFKFKAKSGAELMLKGSANGKSIYNFYDDDKENVYFLGQFQLYNNGSEASAPQVLEFTYQNSDKIGVTAQRIPASDGSKVKVWYQTKENSTEQEYTGDLTSNGGFVLFDRKTAGLGENDFFTNIRAEVGAYNKDYVGYVASRSEDPTSGCATTYGKLLTNEAAVYENFASMKMHDVAETDGETLSVKYKVSVTKVKGEIPFGVENAYDSNGNKLPILDKISTTAGEKVAFNGLIGSSAYPYSFNNVMMDPVIYIRLPEKVTIEDLDLYSRVGSTADKLFLGDVVVETATPQNYPLTKGVDYDIETSETDSGGYVLHTIEFKSNKGKIGWFTEDLGQYQIGLSFNMNIAKDADAMTLNMRDCVRVKSKSIGALKVTSGTMREYLESDTNDMDKDGDTTELFATFNVNVANDTKLSIVAARLGLTFTFGAALGIANEPGSENPDDYSNYEQKNEKVYLNDAEHVVDMLFTLRNETGREFGEADAKAFYYFIPVPKKGDFWDSHMQDKAFEFNMALEGPPIITGPSQGNVLVKYSTTVDSKANSTESLHYSNKDNYVVADDIKNWNDVKMIRIAAKDSVEKITKEAALNVRLSYKPEFKDNADLVGSIVNFGPCGVSPYSVGTELNSGHNPLSRIQVEFQTGVIAGKLFLDNNFNGVYDEETDELYNNNSVKIEACHEDAVGNTDETKSASPEADGSFKFTGLRAGNYHVTVTNPGGSDANGENPLKFSLSDTGQFKKDSGANTATAKITVDKENSKENQKLEIGFQIPHEVTFNAVNANVAKATTKVWHGDKLNAVPAVTANAGWKFTEKWTGKDGALKTTDELKNLTINEEQTFTAEVEKLYAAIYDGNGNTAGNPPESEQYIAGDTFSINAPDKINEFKKDDAIFAGWSTKKIEAVLQADADPDTIAKIIADDEYTMPEGGVTFYAVWATDANGNKTPDYNDSAVHVRYHSNNGENIDVVCPHHHVSGATASLSSTAKDIVGEKYTHNMETGGETGKFTFTKTGSVFVGWSTEPFPKEIVTLEDYEDQEALIFTELTMEDSGNDVYAVWAQDRNGNGIADYKENFEIKYDGNALGGEVSGLPKDSGDHIPNDKVTLSVDKPTHSDVEGKKVLFIGWTTTPTTTIYSRENVAPETVKEVTFGSSDITVYAAWGYDEDDDGTVDALETYSLIYDLNGGSGTAPAKQTGVEKGTRIPLTTEKDFTRNEKELFMGWSRTKITDAFMEEQKEDAEKILITGTEIIMGTEDVTLYAVWAEDKNGNGTADYMETVSLIYNGNAIKGSVQNAPTDNKKYIPDEEVALSEENPTHSDDDGKKVRFIGWTTAQTTKIYSRADAAPATVKKVTFGDENITVYAAWGYDENEDGTPDVIETYSLIYDLNGGSGTAPAKQTGIEKETSVPIAADKSFTRYPKEKFVGWSKTQYLKAFTSAQKIYAEQILITGTEIIMGTEDVTLYAVWAEDRNENGIVDYDETVKITYNGNAQGGGTVTNLPTDSGSHILGDTVILSVDKPIHSKAVNGRNVIFIGWTENQTDKIYGEDETPPETINKVTLGNSDATVYAAWAYDAHVWSEWETVTAATCTEKGSEKHICEKCGIVETRDIAATGHAWEAEFTVDKEATCTNAGIKSIHCTKCDAKQYETEIPANGHTWGEWETEIEASCTEKGIEKCKCTKCEATKTREVPMKEHTWSEWETVNEASCTEKGSEQRECTVCGAVEIRDIEATGHAWEAEFTIDKEADCTNEGIKSIHCTKCESVKDETIIPAKGHKYDGLQSDDKGHWHVCFACGEATAIESHIWGEWMTESEASRTEKGIEQRVCTICGAVETREVDVVVSPPNNNVTNTPNNNAVSSSDQIKDPKHPSVSVPQTGDDNSLWLWIFMLGLSTIGIGAASAANYKKRDY